MPAAGKKGGFDAMQMFNELGALAVDVAENGIVRTPQGPKLSLSKSLMTIGNIGGVRDTMRKEREAGALEAFNRNRGVELANALKQRSLENDTIDRAQEQRERAQAEVAKSAALGMFRPKARARISDLPAETVIGLAETKKKTQILTHGEKIRAREREHQKAKGAILRAALSPKGGIKQVGKRIGQPKDEVQSIIKGLITPTVSRRKAAKLGQKKAAATAATVAKGKEDRFQNRMSSADFAVAYRADKVAREHIAQGAEPMLASVAAVMGEQGYRKVLSVSADRSNAVETARTLMERMNLMESLEKQGLHPGTTGDERYAMMVQLLVDAGIPLGQVDAIIDMMAGLDGGR